MPRTRMVIRGIVITVLAVVALRALWTPDQTTDVLGAILAVLWVGWLVVDLFRARDRLVK